MKRIAIVAESEELRRELAEALGDFLGFEVVSATTSAAAIDESADVVVTARVARAVRRASRVTGGGGSETSRQLPSLTQREREILALLADGLGNKQIAARLAISTSTVKTHLEVVFEKLDVTSRAEAVAAAVRRGLLFL